MDKNSARPLIKIEMSSGDIILEAAALLFLVFQIALPLIVNHSIPQSIPTHFNSAGFPDSYGAKGSLWFLPVTSTFLYLLITILQRYPHIYNYPVEITPANAKVQYTNAVSLMRILKTIMIVIFAFINFRTIQVASGKAAGLGKAFLPLVLVTTFGAVLLFIVRAINNKHAE